MASIREPTARYNHHFREMGKALERDDPELFRKELSAMDVAWAEMTPEDRPEALPRDDSSEL